jgi:hypothetical protein
LIYNIALSFTKIAILIQYLRVFPTRKFRIACFTVLAFVIIYALWTFFSTIFMCRPIAAFWDRTLPDGHCLTQSIWFFNAGFNIAIDLAIIALPMPVVRQLRLPKRQKRLLIGVFGLGSMSVS